MNIRPIRTQADYREAVGRVATLMEKRDELDVLLDLINVYERDHWHDGIPLDPIEAIKFRMEQAGLKPVNLVPYIGSRSKVSEVLAGKRRLSLSMRQRVCEGLGIPAAVMLGKPEKDEDDGPSGSYLNECP